MVKAHHLGFEGGGVEGFADGGVERVAIEKGLESGGNGVQVLLRADFAGGVSVTPTTTEDVLHGGVKYFVSGKSVTVTLSGGSSYSAVDGASNSVALTDNGGGSYTLTMPASDVTISAK